MELELSLLIDALPGLVWTALLDGRAEYLNQRWCEYTGLSLDQAIGYGWQSALHPEDLALALKSWRSFLESGQPGEVQARLRRHDGEYRRFLMSAAPIADKSGRIIKWCGINTDIEERLKAEEFIHAQETLKASEAELRQAYAHFRVAQRLSATGSFVSDLVADDNTWSEELYRIFELDPATKPKVQSVRDVLHPEDVQMYDTAIERAVAGHDVDFEFRIITTRGAVKHLRCAARVSEHIAGRPLFMGAIQDVTQSKVAEAELRRAYEFLAEAQRVSRTGSFLTDLLAEDHHWSQELYRIFDIAPATKVTVQVVRDLVHPEDLPSFDAGIQRSATGEDFDLVFRIVTASGDTRHVHAVARVIEQIAGRPLFIGAMQDVTERRVAEEALNKARAELTQLARVMTLGALTASIAHEVNQPLSGIITNASTCLRMLAADPPNVDGARATAQRTLRDGNRASEVIQRLRTLFTRQQPKTEPVDLNEATREVLALSSSELRGSRVILETDFDESLPAVTGDRVQLQQVILNLILNAGDAMSEIDDRPRNLLVATSREDADWVRLSVRDSGVGIDPKSLAKVFDAFYTTKSHGMGIGLSISRSIIESHGGRMWASANDGPGATFSFAIPFGSSTEVSSRP
jgi:PAS domain S-box-containing protein